ncbi:hypothetical protein M409DRAFT_68767 [Zasmidium cellare ATCC 36951]|uniref:NAD(P)-binding protein n=1 Tax=Zasmidium cellare ATCC 36951 TaxID=1080233 RepID=A0A6A6CAB3_ZASCE|nr:uncharacterized protein M409DRAFT_68767 [Zasmidium cellare ATCC 36951]KAF2163168.1 hypothetical protein M409DRAFT_68767 [Zasmidium cellare ATCC 36951]
MAQYQNAYNNPNGPGDERPTAMQIVQDLDLVGKLGDKTFLVTGVSSGIGVETLRALYATGAHVFGTVRDIAKGQATVDEIEATTKGGRITLLDMELDSLESIRKAASQFFEQSRNLHLLVCNAGVMMTPEGKTEDGFETQFGTNFIGHFYLFQLLKSALLASAASDFPSRIISLSSKGHRYGRVRFNDYNFTEPNSYHAGAAYGQAKAANIWFANELERRYGEHGLHAISLHPGGIWSGLQTHFNLEQLAKMKADPVIAKNMMSVEQGATTSVYAALVKDFEPLAGKYIAKCAVQGPASAVEADQGKPELKDDGYAPWAYNIEGEKRLWKDALAMLGLEDT